MKLLLLVEGKRTEKGLYSKWVNYILPTLNYSNDYKSLQENQYAIISGNGYPGYLNIILNTFRDIESGLSIDYLFICVDSEENSLEEKRDELTNYILSDCPRIQTPYTVIVQNHCIETWLLGNAKLNINNTHNEELIRYREFYNINRLDPEGMPRIDHRSIGKFSYAYLQLVLAEHNLRYWKSNIRHVSTKSFFLQLIKRHEETGHMTSFGFFCTTFSALRGEH